MERDRWEQIERLYHAALEREPQARDAFLDEACAGDDALRSEVAGLLACDNPSDSFIQSPAIEIAARAIAADPHIEASTQPMVGIIAGSQILSLLKLLRETALHIFSLRSRRQSKAWGGARQRATPGMTGDLSTSPRNGRQRLMLARAREVCPVRLATVAAFLE